MKLSWIGVAVAGLLVAILLALLIGCPEKPSWENNNRDLATCFEGAPSGEKPGEWVMPVPKKECEWRDVNRVEWCGETLSPLDLKGGKPNAHFLLSNGVAYATDGSDFYVHFSGRGHPCSRDPKEPPRFEGQDFSGCKLTVECTSRSPGCLFRRLRQIAEVFANVFK